jgi:ferredoxin-nitrate reductase
VRLGDIKRGHLFAPFGYGDVNALIGDELDPFSKEPELKFIEVEVKCHEE